MSVCPDTGIKDFPIQNEVPITDALNQSIQENFQIEFLFAPRADVPTFKSGNEGFLDEGIYRPGGTSQNTLRLRGSNFTLHTVQIAVPQHSKFLKTELRNLNRGEIIMVYKNTSGLGESYCFVCIPLIERSTSNPSAYLESMRKDQLPNRPISLESLIPATRDFISYITCLSQVKESKTSATQVQVFYFVSGLEYDGSKIDAIRNMYYTVPTPGGGRRGIAQKNFAELFLPDSLKAKTSLTPFLLTNEVDYKNFLRYGFLKTKEEQKTLSTPEPQRVDSTDSYKCVPLNPDKNIVNKHIVIDTEKGVPLDKVLAEKKLEDSEVSGEITPGDVERMISVVMGIILGIFVLSIIAYIFTLFTSKNAGPAFPWLTAQYASWLPTVFIAFVVGIASFLIGFFTHNMTR